MVIIKNVGLKIGIILIVLMCFSYTCEGLKVLGIFPFNGKSHFNTYEKLMKGLAEKGHEVDVYNHFPQKKSIPNYKDFNLAGMLPPRVNNLPYSNLTRYNGKKMNFEVLQKVAGESICDLMKNSAFQELFKTTKKYDVVITEVK